MPKSVQVSMQAEISYNEITAILESGCWQGRRCFILGGGESLKEFDISKLKGELVIGINRAFELGDFTICYFMDVEFYQAVQANTFGTSQRWKEFKGYKVALCPRDYYKFGDDVYVVRKRRRPVVSRDLAQGIYGGNNSGIGAIMLAACLGANPIYLLGYDMQCKNSTHWHSGYTGLDIKRARGRANIFKRRLEKISGIIKDAGVEVINLTPGSALECFKTDSLKNVLQEGDNTMPTHHNTSSERNELTGQPETQLEMARNGEITSAMEEAARYDDVCPEFIRDGIANGTIVISGNIHRKSRVVGIGKGLRTKVNASIGTSPDIVDIDMEIKKAKVAEKYGADTLMELSTGGDLNEIRRRVLDATSLMVGTVPLYQAAIETIRQKGSVVHMEADFLFDIIEQQAEEGIGFMAIHCGINLLTLERLRKQGYRFGGLVSRGGSFLTAWMNHNKKENPLYEQIDRLIDIMKKHDVILSLGNGLRAGAVHDSTDRAQIQELIMNSEIAEHAQKRGVQVIVEGPGHIPIDEIEANVILQKRLSNNAPFYMLGPITTDIAPGYDHISAAIGAALSSRYGADFICYVTPPEHLALPTPDDVREGVMAARIAVHVGDMVKLKDKVKNADLKMGIARRDLDWDTQYKTAISAERAKEIRDSRPPMDEDTCTMCGKLCSLKTVKKYYQDALEDSRKKSYVAAL